MIKKLIQNYYLVPEPAKASIWYTISSIIQKAISLLMMPIFLRIMTTEEYGVYTLYQSWYNIIIVFATLNMFYGVYNNALTKINDDKNRITTSMLGLSSMLTVILFIIFCIVPNYWQNRLGLSKSLIVLMFIQMLFESAFRFWAANQRYNYKYKRLVLFSVLMAVLSAILSVFLVVLSSHKAEAKIFSYAVIQILFGMIFYVSVLRKNTDLFDKYYWKYSLSFSIPLIPHYLSNTLLNQADRIMIANIVGIDKAAIYGVAYTMAMMMNIITTAINNSFIPYAYKKLHDKKIDDIEKTSNILIILVATIVIISIAFSPEIIWIFTSDDYKEALYIMPPISASVFFMFLYPLFGNIEFYFEKTKFVSIASAISAVLNIILNYYFINMYGYYAAAYTTLFCYIVYSFAHYVFYKYLIKKRMGSCVRIYNIKIMVVISCIIVATSILMMHIYENFYIRYGIILIIILGIIKFRKLIIEKLKTLKKGTE